MQMRCANCGRNVTLVATGVVPEHCPHCHARPLPKRLGRYRIERLIAAGGMGEVYFARHADLGTPVAIKLLPPPVAEDVAVLRERFAREARLQASIDHPGVVQVLDCEVAGDRPFLVLEYVAGLSLRQRLRSGPLPVGEALRITAAVADVLAAAHRQGVLHRDVKPENVLQDDDGRVRVLDFGIARARDGEDPVTRTGELVGTPQYMAPEQLLLAGDELDERCDVHALGVLAYELLTGRAPFAAANLFAALKLVESLVPEPASKLRPEVPAAVDLVLQKALQKDRDARHGSAAEFAAALRSAADPALDVTGGHPAARTERSWRTILFLLVLASIPILLVWSAVRTVDRWLAANAAPGQVAVADPLQLAEAAYTAGEFHAAAAAFARLPGEAARQRARQAWLAAFVATPLAADAPRFWSHCDERRRLAWFAPPPEAGAESPSTTAERLLAAGDAPAAWAALTPLLANGTADRGLQTLALLTAHAACHDRLVLAEVATRFPDAEPAVAELLAIRFVEGDAAERAERLQRLAAERSADGADRWLLQLLAAGMTPTASPERLRVFADLAWRNGAGEAAAVWFVGGTLRQAMQRRQALAPHEVEAMHRGLAASALDDAPAARVLRLLLDLQHGAAQAFTVQPALPNELPRPLAFLADWHREPNAAALTALWSDERSVADELALPFAADLPLPAATTDASWPTLRRWLHAGQQPPRDQLPWSRLQEAGELHARWREEVCGGVR